jgi:hypothetical protein
MPLTIKRTNSTSIAANSVLFNGSNQYLTATRSGGWLKSANNFTMECWVYFIRHPSAYGGYYASCVAGTSDNSYGWEFNFGSSNGSSTTSVAFSFKQGGGVIVSRAFNTNTWYHFAVVRRGTTVTLYIDGTSASTATIASWTENTALKVGALNLSPYFYYFPGYISNFRIVDGTAVYTSNFTPPTTPLTAIANTALLTCNAPTIVDSSTNNFAITNNGAATVSSLSPFVALPSNNFQFARRASTAVGRSVLFNGSNQYLSVPNNAALALSTGDFTVECWFKVNNNSAAYWIVDSRNVGSDSGFNIFLETSSGYNVRVYTNGAYLITGTAVTITPGVWYHVAFVRNSGTSTVYVNGQVAGSASDSTNYTQPGVLRIGVGWNLNNWFPGYISNLRIVKGTALYTASFTPPTTPLTAIANTSLLTCNAATIVDSSSNNFTITNNNSATVSSISPFVVSGGGMSLKKVFADPIFGTQKAIFGYGNSGGGSGGNLSTTNLVSSTGVVATDTAGVGTVRSGLTAAGYGTDKAIFGYGYTSGNVSMTNLVSNAGIVATDTTGVGTARVALAAAGYGIDKAIFGYGWVTSGVSTTNKVSNTGVVATDTAGVGTSRGYLSAANYGTDKAIFGYGYTTGNVSMTNLVSNTGAVATDTTGVGTQRHTLTATGYGTDKAIFGYGYNGSINLSMTNLVSNTGVVATDTTGVGTARRYPAAAGYGSDKAIFGYGYTTGNVSMTNLVSNTGVVATDTIGVGTARSDLAAAGYSLT